MRASRDRPDEPPPAITIAGVELVHRIRKGQFDLGKLRLEDTSSPALWNAVLAA